MLRTRVSTDIPVLMNWRQSLPRVFLLWLCQLVHQVFFFCVTLMYHLSPAMFLALIRYGHIAKAGIQPDSLLGAAPATMAQPMAARIEVIATSSSTDPGVGLLT